MDMIDTIDRMKTRIMSVLSILSQSRGFPAGGLVEAGGVGGEAYAQLADAIRYVLTDPLGVLGTKNRE